MENLKYIVKFMNDYSCDEEAIKAVSEAYEKIKMTENGSETLKKAEKFLFSKNIVEPNETYLALIAGLAEKSGINKYTAYLVFHIMATKKLKEIYDKMNIDKTVECDTLKDLYFKMQECKLMTGVYGLYTPRWLYGYYRAERFAFDNLQFEIAELTVQSAKIGNTELKKGDKTVRFHIPRGGNGFDRESRLKSYKKAYNFFKSEFKTKEIPFTCNTWILYPPHREFLNPNSNIVDFMDEFVICEVHETDGNLWRIFGVEYAGNPDDMPETTSLMRGYKKMLKEGKPTGVAYGVFLFDGDKISYPKRG